MSYETTSDASRSATHHPLKPAPGFVEAPVELPMDRVTKLEQYIENYVQPLAESVQMLVSNMEKQEQRLQSLENRLDEIKKLTEENDSDFVGVFKKLVEFSDSVDLMKQRVLKLEEKNETPIGNDGDA